MARLTKFSQLLQLLQDERDFKINLYRNLHPTNDKRKLYTVADVYSMSNTRKAISETVDDQSAKGESIQGFQLLL